jgi:transcriptional regulator with XRE-family HTH domain
MTLDPPFDEDDPLRRFAALIRSTREYRGWSQDDLAERAGVSRPTINRYEQAKTKAPQPEQARAIFIALRLDPRRIPVLLGYVTEEEMGLPPDTAREFHATTEDAIAILEDPKVDSRRKAQWLDYLRFLAGQEAHDEEGRRRAG